MNLSQKWKLRLKHLMACQASLREENVKNAYSRSNPDAAFNIGSCGIVVCDNIRDNSGIACLRQRFTGGRN